MTIIQNLSIFHWGTGWLVAYYNIHYQNGVQENETVTIWGQLLAIRQVK